MTTTTAPGRNYRPRIIDAALQDALETAGAVVIEGARASGKTMTALHASRSHVFLDDPEIRKLVVADPRSLLQGSQPRLLDEWQSAPELWNLVRRAVDFNPQLGQFILTGSAVPADDVTRHTGAGRFLRLRQRTMTWWEKQDTPPTETVSLTRLFAGERPERMHEFGLGLRDAIAKLLQPGFPGLYDLPVERTAARLRAYLNEITRTDIQRIGDIRHNPGVIDRLIFSLARHSAADVTLRTMAADLQAIAPGIKPETVGNYVSLLERLFFIEPQLPWAVSLRSRARIRTSPKLHLVDPALAAVALGANAQRLAREVTTLGVLFESAVTHDISVLLSPISGQVFHYRDSNGYEIDIIATLPDGTWGAIEVKLGVGQLTDGQRSLADAIGQFDLSAVGEPAFCLVVTATGPILTMADGTVTAPLHALAP